MQFELSSLVELPGIFHQIVSNTFSNLVTAADCDKTVDFVDSAVCKPIFPSFMPAFNIGLSVLRTLNVKHVNEFTTSRIVRYPVTN